MRRKPLTLAAVMAAVCLPFAVPFRAQALGPGNLELCNHYSHEVSFALGWTENRMPFARGWWNVTTGHCVTVTLKTNVFYWRAESVDYPTSGGMVRTVWGDRGKGFCTVTTLFYYENANGPCGSSKMKGFRRSFKRTDGVPIYETVTIGQDGGSSQSVKLGHTQTLIPPP